MTEFFNNTYEGNRGIQYNEEEEGDEDNDYDEYDGLESSLLGESETFLGSSGGSSLGNKLTIPQLEKKMNLSVKVTNEIIQSEKKGEKRLNYYGRDDRATSEQVLDPRTRMILFKLLNSHYLLEINGCLSTGKEANVYYAKGEKNLEYAVKIFKTSILVFKDRDRYCTLSFPSSSHISLFLQIRLR
jgi:RIO kinase 1